MANAGPALGETMPSAPPSSIEHMAGGRSRYAMSVRRQLNRLVHQQQPGDDDECCPCPFRAELLAEEQRLETGKDSIRHRHRAAADEPADLAVLARFAPNFSPRSSVSIRSSARNGQ